MTFEPGVPPSETWSIQLVMLVQPAPGEYRYKCKYVRDMIWFLCATRVKMGLPNENTGPNSCARDTNDLISGVDSVRHSGRVFVFQIEFDSRL